MKNRFRSTKKTQGATYVRMHVYQLKQILYVSIRVTRLGAFSPNRWLFTFVSCMKITELAQIFGQPFATVKVMH
jgi:hypothetical protein